MALKIFPSAIKLRHK